MDKSKEDALKRIAAIEAEAKELRKIVEDGDKVVFNENKIYVETNRGCWPCILVGKGDWWRFQTLQSSVNGNGGVFESGQEAIDHVIKQGHKVWTFTDTQEALQFFIKHLED